MITDENKNKKITIEITRGELLYLENDLIHYILDMKKKLFGEKWNFGTDITEVDTLTPEQEQTLKDWGYYSRVELLHKLEKIEEDNFPSLECCG